MERTRNGLSDAIVNVLESWPGVDRQVFTRSHYRGESVERISDTLGLSVSEVRSILEQCGRRLRQALKSFRRSGPDSVNRAELGNTDLAPSTICPGLIRKTFI